MRTVTKKLSKLTPEQYRACYSLNMRDDGLMRQALVEEKDKSPDSMAVMIWDKDLLIGWMLMTPTTYDGTMEPTYHAKRVSKYGLMFYVRVSHRRRGVGKRLMNVANKYDARPYVMPHDRTSASFFADYRVTVEGYRVNLLRSAKKRKLVRV